MSSKNLTEVRPIHEIAEEILTTWKHPNIAAKPYLYTMFNLNTASDNYGPNNGRSSVERFLANAQSFRGEDARRLKAELKAHLKDVDTVTSAGRQFFIDTGTYLVAR